MIRDPKAMNADDLTSFMKVTPQVPTNFDFHRSYAVDGSLYRGCARSDRTAWRLIRAWASDPLLPVVNA